MKANELMIGDWVMDAEFDHNIPRRVEIIEPRRVWLEGNNMYQPIGTIQPIPLTVEILERNGFTPTGGGDKSYMLTTPFGIPELRYNIYVGFKAGYIEVFAAHPNTGVWRKKNHTLLEVCGMYVHELQHALRLCGIEKEIEL